MAQDSEKRDRINGVFSSQEVHRVGTGSTTKRTIHKTFWFCEELSGGEIEVQPLNSNYVPSGPKKQLTKDDFLFRFSPEPEFYVSNVYPKMRELNKTIALADRHRKNKEYFSAEMEYGNALKIDEDNIRANFGLGITYLERGETNKAENIFGRLVKLDAAFEEKHKHLFNEFGMNLRKNKMFDQAVTYYARAEELAFQDEHLYHNMARVHLEKKDPRSALLHLLKSLDMNPGLEPSIQFLQWMHAKNLIPEDLKPQVAQAVYRIQQARSGEKGSKTDSGRPGPSQVPAQPSDEPTPGKGLE